MIEELVVSENALDQLPSSIGSMTVLRVLKVANNRLNEVPPEVSKCLALKEVDFTGNDTRNLPGELQTNVAMVIWLMSRELRQRTEVRQLEGATAELEDAARLQDEKRIELEDKIKAVEAERDKLDKMMPYEYLKWQKKFDGIKSKVCTIS